MATFKAPALATGLPAGATGKTNTVTRSIKGDGKGGTVAAASILRMLRLPANIQVHDVKVWADEATTSLAFKAGYTDADGGTLTDDDGFIVAATALAVAGTRANMNIVGFPPELRRATFLELVTSGATMLATTTVYVTVTYTYLGSL